jgi:hypothetical protein
LIFCQVLTIIKIGLRFINSTINILINVSEHVLAHFMSTTDHPDCDRCSQKLARDFLGQLITEEGQIWVFHIFCALNDCASLVVSQQ